jgi:hypothetical protein
MKFRRGLLLCLPALLGAQEIDIKPVGGGEIKIGAAKYQFQLAGLSTAPSKGGLAGAVKVEGDLVPEMGGLPFHMTLTLLRDGTLYMLRLERRSSPKAYPDTWAATAKTRVRPLRMEERPGGRIELRCEGPLSGYIAQRPQEAAWSGTIWAVLPGGG